MTSETLQEEEKPEEQEESREEAPSKEENLEKPEEEPITNISEDSDQEPEQEEEESQKSNKISVTEYGVKSGPAKCPVCTRAFKFFQSPKMKRFFNFKYADLLKEKHRKVADREGFDSMPFFKVRRPGNDKSEFIVGFTESDWEEMIHNK